MIHQIRDRDGHRRPARAARLEPLVFHGDRGARGRGRRAYLALGRARGRLACLALGRGRGRHASLTLGWTRVRGGRRLLALAGGQGDGAIVSLLSFGQTCRTPDSADHVVDIRLVAFGPHDERLDELPTGTDAVHELCRPEGGQLQDGRRRGDGRFFLEPGGLEGECVAERSDGAPVPLGVERSQRRTSSQPASMSTGWMVSSADSSNGVRASGSARSWRSRRARKASRDAVARGPGVQNASRTAATSASVERRQRASRELASSAHGRLPCPSGLSARQLPGPCSSASTPSSPSAGSGKAANANACARCRRPAT